MSDTKLRTTFTVILGEQILKESIVDSFEYSEINRKLYIDINGNLDVYPISRLNTIKSGSIYTSIEYISKDKDLLYIISISPI